MSATVPIGLAEQTEIAAYVDFAAGAPPLVREALGVGVLRFGSRLALAIREDPTRFFNRTGGFSADEPVTEDVLDRAIDFYREQGVSTGTFMIAPQLLPPDWDSTVRKRNLAEGARHVKLACDLRNAPTAAEVGAALDPGLRVGAVEPHQAREWATLLTTTFGMTEPPAMAGLAEACVGRAGWQQYGVFDGERIVAVGSVFVNGECADMFGGATHPDWRGRGAQSALLAARVRAARDAGCRWLVAETGAEGPGEHNSSLRNMLRVGFEPQYERVAWRWLG